MANQSGIRAGVRRGVHALIQTLGATAVQLRLPAPPIAGDPGEELGLRAPEFQVKLLEPVAVCRGSKGVEVLVAAAVLEAALGVADPGAQAPALRSVAEVQIADERFLPAGLDAVPCQGGVCLYRILLRPLNAEAA